MLFTEEKERAHRFKLALRMGLPIFALAFVVSLAKIIDYTETIPSSFYIISVGVLGVMVYFIFYMIYKGMDETITDPITHTFTREYLFNHFQKQISKTPYTVILVSIDNLHDINDRFGVKNGDRVLYETAQWIGRFLENKGISKFPIGHFKGGDFLIGLEGDKSKYLSAMELMCIKFEDHMVDEIEVHISGAIVDTKYSKDIHQMTDKLFEMQRENRDSKVSEVEEFANPSELELEVVEAIKTKSLSLMYQKVVSESKSYLYEASIKLTDKNSKYIHQKNYIPIIDRLGLRREFDMMVVEALAKDCCRYKRDVRFAVNIAPSTARNKEFFEYIKTMMFNNETTNNKIVFILSEKEHYVHTSRYDLQIQAYRRMGVEIAFDFLGEYHSTFDYLKEIKVDYLRFDGSFGKEIENKILESIIKGFVTIAHELEFKLWIKMIEDETSLEIAKSIQVDLLQGYAVAKIEKLEDII